MRLGGAYRDAQGGGDLGVGHAEAHQLEHLAFAVGDPGYLLGLAAGAGLAGELPDQAAGDAWRDDGVADRHHADRGQDVLQRHVLDQEPARPGPERLLGPEFFTIPFGDLPQATAGICSQLSLKKSFLKLTISSSMSLTPRGRLF